jgi:hypothetical protein
MRRSTGEGWPVAPWRLGHAHARQSTVHSEFFLLIFFEFFFFFFNNDVEIVVTFFEYVPQSQSQRHWCHAILQNNL